MKWKEEKELSNVYWGNTKKISSREKKQIAYNLPIRPKVEGLLSMCHACFFSIKFVLLEIET